MNNSTEDLTVAGSIFVPPKPHCRRPLNRMMENQSPGKPRYSCSPKRDSDFNYDSSSNDDCYISSDDSEDYEKKKIVERESSPYEQQKSYRVLESDESRHKKFSCSPSNVESRKKSPKTSDAKFRINSQKYEKIVPPYTPEFSKIPEELRKINLSTYRKNSISKSDKKKKFSPKTCVACFIVLSVFGVILVSTLPNKVNSIITPYKNSKILERLDNFRNDICVMKKEFPAQDHNTWEMIRAGVSEIIRRPKRPWMFVLFSNETEELECLAECIGKISSKALLSPQSLSLKPKDLGNNHGIAIERWRHEIKKKKVVVIHDLLSIDSGAIQAFHSMCDRENPLVEEAVYIMTIITKNFVPEVESPERFIANELTNRFSNKLAEDKLQPLITRIIDGPIIPIRREVSLTGCEDCIR